MLECSRSCKQPNCIEAIPSSFSHSTIYVSVNDHRRAKFSSVPCHKVSFIFTTEVEESDHKSNSRLRRSHVQKCKKLERLRKDLTKLQRENGNLERICADLQNSSTHSQATWDTQRNLMHTGYCSRQAVTVTDPNLADNGIVYVSPAFLQMTGYAREQILGRSCRFLQGPRTCPSKINELRKAIEHGEEWVGTLVNYKADNTPFWNRLCVTAVRNSHHIIVNYVGLAVEVELPDADDPDYELALADFEGSYSTTTMN